MIGVHTTGVGGSRSGSNSVEYFLVSRPEDKIQILYYILIDELSVFVCLFICLIGPEVKSAAATHVLSLIIPESRLASEYNDDSSSEAMESGCGAAPRDGKSDPPRTMGIPFLRCLRNCSCVSASKFTT